jgi:hypothetical protein
MSDCFQLFAAEEGSSKFCLVHLFTSQSFNGGVLGLGFIAGTNIGSAGGICTAAAYKQNNKIYFNTALSSAKSTYGDTVITREADIVTAHGIQSISSLICFVSRFSHYFLSFSITLANFTCKSEWITEFGHNWGSYHDPATDECSPSFRDGGSFVMHTYSVSGYDVNNKVLFQSLYIIFAAS